MVNKPTKTILAHCPKCDDERRCDLHCSVQKLWKYDDKQGHTANGGLDHSLLECRGCETVFYEASSWNSEDIDYWYDNQGATQGEYTKEKITYPKPDSKSKPIWLDAMFTIDQPLHNILNETYTAFDNQSYMLTAVGLRTALDRSTEILKIDPAKRFEEKLAELQTMGWIGESEKEVLEVVTDAGSAAVHRGWEPNASEVAHLITAMEVFLQRAFILGQNAIGIKANIPAKAKRQKKPAQATQ